MKREQLRIVAIDDDELDLTILRRHLEKLGDWPVSVTCTTNAGMLADALEDLDVDIIFLDYSLGRENAMELLEGYDAQGPVRPVIVLTGHDTPDVAAETMRAGARLCLPKQYLNPELLKEMLEQILEPSHP